MAVEFIYLFIYFFFFHDHVFHFMSSHKNLSSEVRGDTSEQSLYHKLRLVLRGDLDLLSFFSRSSARCGFDR